MKTQSLLAALVLLTGATVHAAGFAIDTHSGRATAMSTAVTAFVDDPSAVYYNPAGVVQGEGLRFAVGDTLIVPQLTVEPTSGAGKTTTNFRVSPPPHLFITYGLQEDLSLGFGIFTPHGANTRWEEGWPGQFRTMGSTLQTFYFNPEVAYRVHDRVRIGAGFQAARAVVDLRRNVNLVDSVANVRLVGGAWGVGGNAGVMVDILPKKLWAGASYRSAVKFDFEGTADFENVPVEFQSRLVDQDVRTTVTLPNVVNLGLAYRATDTLLLAFDVNWYDWSSFTELDIQFEDESLRSYLPKRWNDAVNYHLGTEWNATRELQVRGGLMYDPAPTPVETLTPDIPDADRLKVTVGGGYSMGNLQFDLGYQFVYLLSMDSTAPGFNAEYGGTAHVLSLTVGASL